MLTSAADSNTQAGSWAELMHSTQPAIDVLDDAQAVQNAWNDEESATASSAVTSASSSSATSDVQNTEPTEPTDSDEEFGDFVSAPTDPFKQPIYTSALPFYLPDEDETLELLHTNSAPEWQTGIFVGHGLIEPVRASLDTSSRSLRRAGKLALRKLQIMREKKLLEMQERAPHLFRTTQEDQPSQELPKAIPRNNTVNEYLSGKAPLIVKHPLDGVVRPVGFAKPSSTDLAEIDEMMEDERSVWG
jgi:hypothetical protein